MKKKNLISNFNYAFSIRNAIYIEYWHKEA